MINIYSPLDIDSDYFLTHDEEHELFYAKINALPETIQNILLSVGLEETLEKTSGQFNLKPEQIGALTRLVRDIIITDVYFGNLVNELKLRLHLDEEGAKTVAAQLISEIFSPALEDFKKEHKEKFKKGVVETPNPPLSIANPNNVLDLRKKIEDVEE